jgi:hypothetical protein
MKIAPREAAFSFQRARGQDKWVRPQPLPHQDAAALASVDEVFVQRRGDGERVAVELVETHLISAGHFDSRKYRRDE